MNFSENFDELLKAFNEQKVDYMVVGGYAVNFHGYERNTSDLDVWVKSSGENISKICMALNKIGFDENALKRVARLDDTQPFLFHVGEKPYDIEVFNFITGVKYEEAEKYKILFTYPDQMPVYFISLKDLIVNKMLSGRPTDKVDVDELQKITRFKK